VNLIETISLSFSLCVASSYRAALWLHVSTCYVYCPTNGATLVQPVNKIHNTC